MSQAPSPAPDATRSRILDVAERLVQKPARRAAGRESRARRRG